MNRKINTIIKKTKRIAIANKESLICGWDLIQKELKKYKTEFIPVDSEHFSIWSVIKDYQKSDIEKIANHTHSELNSSKNYYKSTNDWDIEIIKTSVVKNIGIDLLFNEIEKRWMWLKKKKKIHHQRIGQDISWITKTIRREFGTNVVKKID